MAVRRVPLELNPVTPVQYATGDGSKTPLAGSGAWQSKVWLIGCAYDPTRLITDANADVEYSAAAAICDIYVYADKPGEVQFCGAPTMITATTYRQMEHAVLVGSGLGKTIAGYRVAPGFFYVKYQNGAAAQTVFEIGVELRG